MQYAIADGTGILQAVLDVPDSNPFSWEGPDDFIVRASPDFGLDETRDFNDYIWNDDQSAFELTEEAKVKDYGNLGSTPPADLDKMINEAVEAKMKELGLA